MSSESTGAIDCRRKNDEADQVEGGKTVRWYANFGDGQVCITDVYVQYESSTWRLVAFWKPKATYLPNPGGGLGAVKSYLPTFWILRTRAILV